MLNRINKLFKLLAHYDPVTYRDIVTTFRFPAHTYSLCIPLPSHVTVHNQKYVVLPETVKYKQSIDFERLKLTVTAYKTFVIDVPNIELGHQVIQFNSMMFEYLYQVLYIQTLDVARAEYDRVQEQRKQEVAVEILEYLLDGTSVVDKTVYERRKLDDVTEVLTNMNVKTVFEVDHD